MSSCATCGNLVEHVTADLEAGEALPPEVSRLEAIAGGNARRCPTCGAWFLYTYDYEYGALGDGWEDATLERVDRDRVVAVLLASPPSSAVHAALVELGVADGEAAIMAKLRADLDDPAASHDAVRRLVIAALAQSDVVAIERLLRHVRAKVRADTLYQLQSYRGSLVFRAVAASTDPSPVVREAATIAAFVAPPRDVGLEPAIIACLADPAEEVRSNAAWTLAVFAEDKRDVRAALPALAARLVEDAPQVRTTAARALIGAVSAGADCSGIVSVIERLDPTDDLRTKVLDAIRTEASRTRRVHVWRCPKCGSTDAGPNESRSAYEFTYMQCNGCKSGGLVDSWERDMDWAAEVEVPLRSTELPSHVTPLEPGTGYWASEPAALPSPPPAPPSPPPAPPSPPEPAVSGSSAPSNRGRRLARTIGCSRCFGDDAASAWEVLRSGRPLVDELHWHVDITACSCGQSFAIEFTERVDYLEGSDDQTWVALPITRDERARLERCDKSLVRSVHAALDTSRRFLVHNEVGAQRDTWWRAGTLTLELSTAPTSIEIAFSAEPRDTPTTWLLDAEEVAELWALGVPLDAACVPDEQLRLALTSRRVKQAWTDSSMGTAETYWAVAEPTDGLVQICRDGVVVPPGETAQETPFEDRADDRDVDGVLWAPFYLEQGAALARSIPEELRQQVVDAYARILADLEERWAKGAMRIERAPFVEWLRTDGPVDEAYIERWLVNHNKRSVDHLVQGIRARWLTHDVMTAFGAVMTSVERIKADPELQRATRIELLRSAARVVSSR